jgi:autotransporter-associated beta strand protein
LSGANSYIGDTNILSGIFKVTGSLSDITAVFINQGAVYKVASTDTVGSIEGAGDIQLFPDKVLTTGGNDLDTTFSGYLRGGGGLSKIGSGVLTISGSKNDYQGRTTISGGTIKLGSNGGIPKSSVTSIEAGATLDVNNQATLIDSVTLNGGAGIGTVQDIMANTALIRDGVLTGTVTSNGGLLSGVSGADLNVESGRTFIRDMKSGTSLGDVAVKGGQLWAASRDNQNNVQTVTVANLTLNTESFIPVDPRNSGRTLGPVQDGLVLGFDDDVSAALNVTDKFTYTNGNVYLFKPAPVSGKAEDYEGTWSAIDFKDGDLSDAEYEKLFSNTYVRR